MDIKVKKKFIFTTKRNKQSISIENYVFSESNHLKNNSPKHITNYNVLNNSFKCIPHILLDISMIYNTLVSLQS